MTELIDNRAHRIRTLKHIIKHLHSGEAPEQVRDQLKQLVKECDATEIAQMEQELMAEGVPVAEIMSMCDLHSQVVKEILVERPAPEMPPGHPVRTFRKENEALGHQVAKVREALAKLAAPAPGGGGSPPADAMLAARGAVNELMDVDKHYQRKENLLFPMLERHGITGPSKVMWGKDDEVRSLLDALHEALQAEGTTTDEWQIVIDAAAEPALNAVEEMIYKEEKILLPMSAQTLTEVEWGEIWRQSPEFGWCLVDPDDARQLRAACLTGTIVHGSPFVLVVMKFNISLLPNKGLPPKCAHNSKRYPGRGVCRVLATSRMRSIVDRRWRAIGWRCQPGVARRGRLTPGYGL